MIYSAYIFCPNCGCLVENFNRYKPLIDGKFRRQPPLIDGKFRRRPCSFCEHDLPYNAVGCKELPDFDCSMCKFRYKCWTDGPGLTVTTQPLRVDRH